MQASRKRIVLFAIFFAAAMAVGLVGVADDGSAPPPQPAAPPAPTASPSAYEGNEWTVVRPGEQARYNQRQALWFRGRAVYQRYCVGCHGEQGKGDGPAAARLITKPRDFTSGIFKFRSTDSSSLPLDRDLHRTITRGLSRVSMPAFPLMDEHDKLAVIEYIKRFYPTWDEELPKRQIVAVPLAPNDLSDPQRAVRGHAVYLGVGCASCHGTDGQGKGATRIEYTDAWGHAQQPFNFTRGSLKGGDDPEDIYRTFHTGLRSVMPQFGPDTMTSVTQQVLDAVLSDEQKQNLKDVIDTFSADGDAVNELSDPEREQLVERNSWDLVAYVISLREADVDPNLPGQQSVHAESSGQARTYRGAGK
jgi:cytochrome c oxidase cbb3-type subunit 2